MWKTVKMLALTAIMISVNGCQLLIDNRSRESGAVVVVPSDEWEAMRQASLAASEGLITETDDTETEMPTMKFEPSRVRPSHFQLHKFKPWRPHRNRYH